jgi:N-acetyl-gamma-glutamylphosphate reductase
MINVIIAGATGWAGSELACAVAKAADLARVATLTGAHRGLDSVLDL